MNLYDDSKMKTSKGGVKPSTIDSELKTDGNSKGKSKESSISSISEMSMQKPKIRKTRNWGSLDKHQVSQLIQDQMAQMKKNLMDQDSEELEEYNLDPSMKIICDR